MSAGDFPTTRSVGIYFCKGFCPYEPVMVMKRFLKRACRAAGLDVRRLPQATQQTIPTADLYQPLYSPWRSPGFVAEYALISPYTLVSEDRCYVLASLATQASLLDGEFWECGVYKGGTAMLLAERLSTAGRPLRLFDTFDGMPETDAERDLHKAGDFCDTSLEAVRSRVRGNFVHFYKGLIPKTFSGLESTRIACAHIDVDIYSSVLACCEFIFPRLCVGGFMIFDDYGFPSCPGARSAVDEFFLGRASIPLVLPTGQALLFKSFA
jgi:O-methyltransferase